MFKILCIFQESLNFVKIFIGTNFQAKIAVLFALNPFNALSDFKSGAGHSNISKLRH